MTIIVIILILALIFEFINGFHDTANAIAMSVSTRALSPRFAVIYAGVLNFIGALVSQAVAKSIGGKIADPFQIENGLYIVIAALIAAIFWNLFTWYYGIPSSSSHTLIGSVAGAVIFGSGLNSINWQGFTDIIQALIISPFLAFGVGFVLMKILALLLKNLNPHRATRGLRGFQIVASGLAAYSHGGNDGQKTMGIIVFALVAGGFQSTLDVPFWVQVTCAATIGLGTMIGGMRIIKTVAKKIFKVQPINGFAADLSSFAVLQGATMLGLPVSTTHVSSSSILGVGSAKRFRGVNWGVAIRIVTTWVITLPISALIAGLIITIINFFL
ncbi:inorganic phosphate transporter [Metabacillus niabensis]|uniref:PiT family inorganic phosphate transporter n=1 Tax=Metabacillus niabensis TaxID=324854 RepID=A0ABT9Z2N9_9BACI|nr:inorganic phosphate transporter [Metabacillus niabensis]MDQ0226487.1 PiT family inorganic phosphate transporter [Metabacillus niabensis]PAD68895.1 anion permease [Bacillus sp. 7586-K]